MNDLEQMKEGIRSIIRSEMKHQNITMSELSRRSGVCPATVKAYLDNERECYIQTIMVMLSALGYTLRVVPK